MFDPNYVLLYVANVPTSAAFYAELLGREPVESQSTFALFVLSSGLKLGLWLKSNVEPAALTPNGGTELAFTEPDAQAVHSRYEAWTKRGLAIAQAPTELDFGLTFVALDPDGHRLRVFTPSTH